MTFRILTDEDVKRILPMDKAIDAVESVSREQGEGRVTFHQPHDTAVAQDGPESHVEAITVGEST